MSSMDLALRIVIGCGVVLAVGGVALVILTLIKDDEEEPVVTSRSPDQRKEQIQNLHTRYDQGSRSDPLLGDHAATSLVIRSSARGRRQ